MESEHDSLERIAPAPRSEARTAGDDLGTLSLRSLSSTRLGIEGRLVATLDLAGSILFANRAAIRALGIAHDELLGRNLLELAHADDVESLRDAFAVAAGGGFVSDLQVRLRDAADGWVTLLVSASGLANGHGEPVAVVVSGADVTRTLALEEENQSQRRFLDALLGKSDMLVVELAPDLAITKWNAACESTLEIGASYALGKDFLELCVAESARADTLRDLTAAREKGQTARRELSVTSGRDGIKSIAWTFLPARDGGGVPSGVVALGHDVTPLRAAQRGERRAEALVDSLISGLADGAFVTGPGGRIRHWNASMEKLTGIARDQAIERRPHEALPWLANSGFSMIHDDLLAGRLTSYQSPPRQIESPSGRLTIVVRSTPFRVEGTAGGAGVVVIVEDLTEVLRVRSELETHAGRERILFESCGDCIYTIDSAGRVIELNPSARRVDGRLPAQRLVGRRFDEYVDPPTRPAVLGAIERARGASPIEASYTTTSEARVSTWNAVFSPIFDPGGRLQCIVVVARSETRCAPAAKAALGATA